MSSSMFILAAVFVITLLIGIPVVWSLALSSMVALLSIPGMADTFLASRMQAGTEQYSLLAIFFFMLAGAIMQHGGIATRLIRFSKSIMGSVRGGLSIVAIVACMFFAALSGSSVATTAAIGSILYPELVDEGYDPGYAAALTVAGGTLGIVIPPSIVFVVYGTTVNTSVADLLMSGLMPGVLAGIALCIYAYIYAIRHGIQAKGHFDIKECIAATKESFFAILMPVIVLGGIYAGVFTPTESAAVACIYGLIVSCFVYRELKFKKLLNIAIDSVKSTANVLMIIMAAKLFSYVLTRNGIPAMLTGALASVITGKVTFLLALNILLLFLGMIMDAAPIILIVAPIIYPIAVNLGIDPVQLGCIVVFNLSVGQATPPFGLCLFAAQPVTKQTIATLSVKTMPFVIILVGMVLLTSFVPAISTFIPHLMH